MAKTYDVWRPTKNLRFVKRAVPVVEFGGAFGREARILQQEWRCWRRGYGHDERATEWRDVPEEPTNA